MKMCLFKDYVENVRKESPLKSRLHVLMRLFFIGVVFHSLCYVCAETETKSPIVGSTKPPSKPSAHNSTTTKPAHTITPARKISYRLVLNNSGPAVLDSTITFTAELIPLTNYSKDKWPYRYTFQWMNMANTKFTSTEGHLTSSIPIVFQSGDVTAGEYPMTVAAFLHDDSSPLVAFQTKKFILTDKLNGHLNVKQYLDYQRFPNKTYSTNVLTLFTVDVNDHFLGKEPPSFKYKWFENNTQVKETNTGFFYDKISSPTNLTIRSEVVAEFTLYGPEALQGANSLNNSQSKHGLKNSMARRTYGENKLEHHHDKNGNFTTPIFFKDPLTDCRIFRADGEDSKKSIATGSTLRLNVNCTGSSPSSVCWNASASNSSGVEPCEPGQFIPTTVHQIQVSLNKTGWTDLHFFVYNDVSRFHISESYYAYDPASGVSQSLYLPIIFGFLGFIVIVVGAVYMMRLRKKTLVEVADFDFHPSLTSSIEANNSIRISKMIRTLKFLLLVRNKDSPSSPQDDTDTNPIYSSFTASPMTQSTESMKTHSSYESL